MMDKESKAVISTELHHAKVHNTKVNRKLYPLLIHSVFNLYFVSNVGNIHYSSWGKCGEMQAKEYESFLRENREIEEWANNPAINMPTNEIDDILQKMSEEVGNDDTIKYYEVCNQLSNFRNTNTKL